MLNKIGCERIVRYIYQTAELYVAWTLAFLNMFQLIILVLALYVLCMVFYDQKPNQIEDDETSPYKFCEEPERKCWLKRHLARYCWCSDHKKRCDDGEEDERGEEFARYRDRDQVYMTSYYL